MLSNTSLTFVAFINLFMIPIIGLRIYCHRQEIKMGRNPDTLFYYALITILNIPLTHIIMKIVEILTAIVVYVETTKYTVIALLSCVLLAYIIEIVKKFIKINVSISLFKKEKSNEK